MPAVFSGADVPAAVARRERVWLAVVVRVVVAGGLVGVVCATGPHELVKICRVDADLAGRPAGAAGG